MIRIAVLILTGSVLAFAQSDLVESRGPLGGIVSLLEGSPNDEVVIAAVRDVGIYRSIDGGESWQPVSLQPGMGMTTVYDIAFHPTSPDTILLATEFGLFRSGDRGVSWSNMVPLPPYPKFSIRYSADPRVLFGSDDNGPLRSNDGGITWFPLKDGAYFGNRSIRRIAVHPADTGAIRLVATTDFSDTTGIFLSTDGGMSWRPFTKALPAGAARRIYAVEMDSTGLTKKNFRVVIGTADGVYGLQTDQADTAWVRIEKDSQPIRGVITGGTLVYDRFDTVSSQPKFSFYLASNAAEYDRTPQKYSSANGLFRISSRNGTIVSVSLPPPVDRVFSELTDIVSIFVPVGSNKSKIYLGTTDGIFISMDGGATWMRKNNGLAHSLVRNAAQLKVNERTSMLFAGVYGGGVVRSLDDGLTWQSANTGIGSPYVTTVQVDQRNQYVYAGTVQSLYRSTDGGLHWSELAPVDSTWVVNPQRYTADKNDMTVRISPFDPNTILFGAPAIGLYLTRDAGANWSPIVPPVAGDTVHVPENIEFDPVDPSAIYYTGAGIFRSSDLGATWSNISGDLPSSAPLPLFPQNVGLEYLSPAINPKNTKEIFISSVFSTSGGSAFRLFRTTDGGTHWDSLPPPVYDAIYDRYDPRRLVVSGPGGIGRTTDGGTTWHFMTDPALKQDYYLLSPNEDDPNVFYAGSESGVQRIQLGDAAHVIVDTTFYDFGNLKVGQDTVRTISIGNAEGLRSVFCHFVGLSDTTVFHYEGADDLTIAAGVSVPVSVRFTAKAAGYHSAVLKFSTTDPLADTLRIVLLGHAYRRDAIDKFSYDFGSVTVGKDSVITFSIDNTDGLAPLSITLVGNSDSVSFDLMGSDTVQIDTGATAHLAVRFAPLTLGNKRTSMILATTDPRFPLVRLIFQGVGVSKNFMSRRVLIDSESGFLSADSQTIDEYYRFLILSLSRAGMSVDTKKSGTFSTYNTVVYVQPAGAPPADLIDSLQRYVIGGGTLLLIGNEGSASQLPFNTFLSDAGWEQKFSVKTGLSFNTNALIDSSLGTSSAGAIVTAAPPSPDLYTAKADSIVLAGAGSLSVDTSVHNAHILLTASSSTLFAEEKSDSTSVISSIPSAIVAAYSAVGNGKIIAVSDDDLWWNGPEGDTTHTVGVFAGDNLQFGLNIFGLIDNLLTRLPEPTPQEAYKLISIPYSFKDSSVLALFKDLGAPNEYLWRMFGRWNEKKGTYEEFPADFTAIRRGEGYWLITKQPTDINFGTTTVPGTDADFEMTLRPGFNLIGNPFPYRVSWATSYRDDSVEAVLWKFDKEFDTTTTVMEPFTGYFLKNAGTTDKIIRINAAQVVSTTTAAKATTISSSLTDGEWKMRILTRSGHSSDHTTFIGMLRHASAQVDASDFSKPPHAPGEFVQLALRNASVSLAADYRPLSVEGESWDGRFTASDAGASISLLMSVDGSFPAGFGVYIIDFETERITEIGSSLSCTIALGEKKYSKDIRIVVGTIGYLQDHSEGIPLVPLQYSLEQNFPNPFNPETSIRYTISHSGNVKIEVFNTLGQRVRSLVNTFQPIGEYIVRWDATGDRHTKVASGVYYYRIRVNDFTGVKKMMLIK